MQSNQFNIVHKSDSNELDLANALYHKGYLPGPNKCTYNNTQFTIQQDSSNKTSNCYFRFQNYKCRKKYAIRINSFFSCFQNKN